MLLDISNAMHNLEICWLLCTLVFCFQDCYEDASCPRRGGETLLTHPLACLLFSTLAPRGSLTVEKSEMLHMRCLEVRELIQEKLCLSICVTDYLANTMLIFIGRYTRWCSSRKIGLVDISLNCYACIKLEVYNI